MTFKRGNFAYSCRCKVKHFLFSAQLSIQKENPIKRYSNLTYNTPYIGVLHTLVWKQDLSPFKTDPLLQICWPRI